MNDPATKRCTRPDHTGNRVLPLNQFNRAARADDGRQAWCRDCMSEDKRARRATAWAAALAHYGQVCACPGCGATDDLTIDHVNGGGTEHRRSLKLAGADFCAWLIAQGFPEGYQTMCNPCNSSKDAGAACRLWHGDPGRARCTGPCGQVKDLAAFNLSTGQRNGRDHRCRDCRQNAARERAVRGTS